MKPSSSSAVLESQDISNFSELLQLRGEDSLLARLIMVDGAQRPSIVSFPSKHRLFSIGERADMLYVLLEGSAQQLGGGMLDHSYPINTVLFPSVFEGSDNLTELHRAYVLDGPLPGSSVQCVVRCGYCWGCTHHSECVLSICCCQRLAVASKSFLTPAKVEYSTKSVPFNYSEYIEELRRYGLYDVLVPPPPHSSSSSFSSSSLSSVSTNKSTFDKAAELEPDIEQNTIIDDDILIITEEYTMKSNENDANISSITDSSVSSNSTISDQKKDLLSDKEKSKVNGEIRLLIGKQKKSNYIPVGQRKSRQQPEKSHDPVESQQPLESGTEAKPARATQVPPTWYPRPCRIDGVQKCASCVRNVLLSTANSSRPVAAQTSAATHVPLTAYSAGEGSLEPSIVGGQECQPFQDLYSSGLRFSGLSALVHALFAQISTQSQYVVGVSRSVLQSVPSLPRLSAVRTTSCVQLTHCRWLQIPFQAIPLLHPRAVLAMAAATVRQRNMFQCGPIPSKALQSLLFGGRIEQVAAASTRSALSGVVDRNENDLTLPHKVFLKDLVFFSTPHTSGNKTKQNKGPASGNTTLHAAQERWRQRELDGAKYTMQQSQNVLRDNLHDMKNTLKSTSVLAHTETMRMKETATDKTVYTFNGSHVTNNHSSGKTLPVILPVIFGQAPRPQQPAAPGKQPPSLRSILTSNQTTTFFLDLQEYALLKEPVTEETVAASHRRDRVGRVCTCVCHSAFKKTMQHEILPLELAVDTTSDGAQYGMMTSLLESTLTHEGKGHGVAHKMANQQFQKDGSVVHDHDSPEALLASILNVCAGKRQSQKLVQDEFEANHGQQLMYEQFNGTSHAIPPMNSTMHMLEHGTEFNDIPSSNWVQIASRYSHSGEPTVNIAVLDHNDVTNENQSKAKGMNFHQRMNEYRSYKKKMMSQFRRKFKVKDEVLRHRGAIVPEEEHEMEEQLTLTANISNSSEYTDSSSTRDLSVYFDNSVLYTRRNVHIYAVKSTQRLYYVAVQNKQGKGNVLYSWIDLDADSDKQNQVRCACCRVSRAQDAQQRAEEQQESLFSRQSSGLPRGVSVDKNSLQPHFRLFAEQPRRKPAPKLPPLFRRGKVDTTPLPLSTPQIGVFTSIDSTQYIPNTKPIKLRQ